MLYSLASKGLRS